MPIDMTLLHLVNAVSVDAGNEAEVIATVACLVNSGRVRLCGNFKGARFDLRELAAGDDALFDSIVLTASRHEMRHAS